MDWTERCWLCCGSKLLQHIDGLLIVVRTVEQRGEFPRSLPSSRSRTASVRTVWGLVKGLGVPDPLVNGTSTRDAGRIGGQGRAFAPLRAGERRSREVSDDVSVGKSLDDLAVVGSISTQRRDRAWRSCRVRPCPNGGGGEHRLRGRPPAAMCSRDQPACNTLGELDRLPRRRPPIGAIQFCVPAEGRAGTGCTPTPVVRAEFDDVRIRLEFVEIGSNSAEWKAWLVSNQSQRTPSAISPATAGPILFGPDSTVLAPL